MAERSLPAPSAVADMCAQTAWKTPDENTRLVLEYGAETIRALMARCVALARQKEPVEKPVPNDQLATVAWEFDVAEGDVICGPDSAIAEINRDDDADGVGEFRTVTIPCVTWFANDRDAVELRALSGWLTQMADWLEGVR